MRLHLVVLAVALCSVSVVAKADTVYNYVGNDFTSAIGPYTTADFLTLSITLSAPLPFTSSLQLYTPTAFSLKDGVQTITNMTPDADSELFYFATSGGVIDEWAVSVLLSATSGIQSCGLAPSACSQTFDEGANGVAGGINLDDPGAWTAAASPTPEPSSITLFGTGVLGLAGVARRKFLKA